MKINRFDKKTAEPAHSGTILASPVVSQAINPPFGHAWGYLENGSSMEGHSHPTEEIYVVVKGEGFVIIDGERAPVSAGDVVEISPNAEHTMECDDGGPLLWAAFWWNK